MSVLQMTILMIIILMYFVGNYAKVPEHFLSRKVLVVGPSADYNRLDIQIECYNG